MRRTKSVAYKMLQSVVLLTLVLGVVIGGVQVSIDYSRQVEDFKERTQEVLNSIETAATKAAYTFDNDLALEVATGLMEFQPVLQVVIIDENEREMVNMTRYRGPLPYSPVSDLLFDAVQLQRVELGLDDPSFNTIGILMVKLSAHRMVKDFFDGALVLLVTALVQSFVISAFILMLFFNQVSRPLRSLAQGFERIDPQTPDRNRLPVGADHHQLEFEQVIGAGNEMLRVIGLHLSARDRAEQNLLRQKLQTEQYLEIAEAIILELDEDANVRLINQRGLDVLGYERDDIIRKNWLEFAVPLTSLATTQQTFLSLKRLDPETSNKGYFEGEVLTKNGDIRWILWHAEVRKGESGEVKGIICSGQDLTKRKEAEEALREAEQQLRTIIETSHEGFAIIDRQTNEVLDINTAWHDMMGYEREEILGQNLFDLVHPLDHHVTRHSLSLAQSHLQYRFQVRLKKKDGSVLYSEANASSLKSDEWERGHNVLFFGDITTRREQEETQRALENQLRQAQKLETLGTMAGGIAHDFNNILTPIVGYSSLLLEKMPQEDKNYQRVEQISQAAGRGQQMIKHILTFSRRSEGEMQSIDIRPVVEEAFGLIQTTLSANIESVLDLPVEQIPVFADSTQIQQIILNLATNAGQAMPDGGQLSISLSTHAGNNPEETLLTNLAPGPYVSLEVSDTGVGMDDETLGQMFDPFFTTKRKGEGTGLGLAMVHGIVKNHYGDIQVESVPDQGTKIRVALPLTQKPTSAPTKKEEIFTGNGERVLVLDDEQINTNFLRDFLTQAGYFVTCFNDSREALEQFKSGDVSYKLILTDQTMPHLSGDQFVTQVREMDDDVPIIMLSGYDKDMTEEKALDCGVDIYLQKPIRIEQLSMAVKGLLS